MLLCMQNKYQYNGNLLVKITSLFDVIYFAQNLRKHL